MMEQLNGHNNNIDYLGNMGFYSEVHEINEIHIKEDEHIFDTDANSRIIL